jgi:hypothetical protein
MKGEKGKDIEENSKCGVCNGLNNSKRSWEMN